MNILYDYWLFWTLILLLTIYKYITRNHKYWEKRNVPGPKPVPFFGNITSFLKKPGHEIDVEHRKKYGKIYGAYGGNQPAIIVGDPEALKLIMVKDWHYFINRDPSPIFDNVFSEMLLLLRDDKWKQVRSIMTPTFTSKKMKHMMEMAKECADNVLLHMDRLIKQSKEGNTVDLKTLFGFYTMDVIAKCAFALDIDCHANQNNAFLQNASQFFGLHALRTLIFFTTPTWLLKEIGFSILPPSAIEFFRSVAEHAITQRKIQQATDAKDFLQLLLEAKALSSETLEAKYEFGTTKENEIERESSRDGGGIGSGVKSTLGKLTETEIIAQSILFLVAGYETTSSLLTYCGYALALHPDIQERLYVEIKEAFANEESINYDSVNKLTYLDAVVSETLRLFTPVTRMNRHTSEDYKLGDIVIEKGTLVILPFYAIHHDEEYFSDPYEFKPERFLPENAHNIKPYTFLPFGAGPRNCIGLRFALGEAKIMLCKLLLRYKLERSPLTQVPIQFRNSFNFLLTDSVVVAAQRRQK